MPLCSPTFLEHVLSTLKKLIKAEKTPKFDDIAVDILTLWKASIPVTAATKHNAMLITRIDDKEELLPMDELLDVFGDTPAKKTVHARRISLMLLKVNNYGNLCCSPGENVLRQVKDH
ncbi:hypothetical protein BGX20_000749 [Mortierella sp. AD010]|nr:hypothetical protein BGX20_000749 [Mortierella sp. AD010]